MGRGARKGSSSIGNGTAPIWRDGQSYGRVSYWTHLCYACGYRTWDNAQKRCSRAACKRDAGGGADGQADREGRRPRRRFALAEFVKPAMPQNGLHKRHAITHGDVPELGIDVDKFTG